MTQSTQIEILKDGCKLILRGVGRANQSIIDVTYVDMVAGYAEHRRYIK